MTNPWDTEPLYHTFEAAGLHCVMARDPLWQHWCGYVGVSSGHPLYGVHYGDCVPAPDAWKKRLVDPDEHGVINLFITAIQADEIPDGFAPLTSILTCHGGLTWSAPRHDWTGWWFGFDCGHSGDYMPGLHQHLKMENLIAQWEGRDLLFDAELIGGRGTYRTFDFVKSECATLAQQIADYADDGSAGQVHALIAALRSERSR